MITDAPIATTSEIARPSMFSPRILDTLMAPNGAFGDALELDGVGFVCRRTGARYPFVDGIPSLYQPGPDEGADVTARVKSFYEENPFPNYDDVGEFGELVSRGRENAYSADLLKSIGYNKTVLECGCGTGQLSNYLQLNNNHVLGVDISLASLRLAIDYKRRNGLERSAFAQMNIFDLAVRDEAFDVVLSCGVLHHTFDARRAFAGIVKKAKPGGIVVVGLYNSIARIPTWVRGKAIGILGPRVDYIVRNRIEGADKSAIWINDQYHNEQETWHSIGEVLDWFDENDIEYMNCSPAILGTGGEEASSLFAETDPGTPYQRVVTQLSWIGTIAREGGLFNVIGRRRS